MANINKVLYNVDQRNDTTSSEKETARLNIGAGTSNSSVSYTTTTLPPTTSSVNEMKLFDDGRTKFDNLYNGVIPKEPEQTDIDKVLAAGWAGSPGKGFTVWKDVHDFGLREVPGATESDAGKVLTVNVGGQAVWQTPTVGASDFGVYELTVTKVLNGTGTELWDGEGLTDANISESYTNCTAATCPVSVGLNGYGGLRVYLDNRYGSITCESHTYVSSNANFANELGMWGYDNLCQMVAGMNRTWYVTDGSNLDQNGIRTTTETLKSGTLTIKFDFVFQV